MLKAYVILGEALRLTSDGGGSLCDHGLHRGVATYRHVHSSPGDACHSQGAPSGDLSSSLVTGLQVGGSGLSCGLLCLYHLLLVPLSPGCVPPRPLLMLHCLGEQEDWVDRIIFSWLLLAAALGRQLWRPARDTCLSMDTW